MVTELRLGDRDVLADAVPLRPVLLGQPDNGIHDRPRPLAVMVQHGVAGRSPLQVDVGREAGANDQAEREPAERAQGHLGRPIDAVWDGIDLVAEDGDGVSIRPRPAVDDRTISLVSVDGGTVGL